MERKTSDVEMHDGTHAPNSCQTCRRRRVKCDRLLPTCQRCSSLKLRCLGYERAKTLVWTNSMASRGRMMGKATFDTPPEPTETSVQKEAGRPVKTRTPSNELDKAAPFPSVSWSLVEPHLQDIPKSYRNYIRYFDLELSKECVVYNNPLTNPFLALMPLIPWSKALSHLMISISAFHFTHRNVVSTAQGSLESSASPSRTPEMNDDHTWQKGHPNYGTTLRTALSSKQRALECLKYELQVDPEANGDAVIAAVILFICLDVVEFGGRSWKHHLRGAEELVQGRKALLKDATSDSGKWLRYFDTACTTFGIMGATLTPARSLSLRNPAFFDCSLLQTLRRSEHQTWVGCPADLLELLHIMNSLRLVSTTIPEQENIVAMLLGSLKDFSPSAWAREFPNQRHWESRYRLAQAYKAAVGVYASHIIGVPPDQSYQSQDYVLDLTEAGISYMLHIPPHDFHIKSLVWPAFVLGAETRRSDLREAVQGLFRHIWVSSCCYNVRTATKMLDVVWTRDQGEDAHQTWLEYIWKRDQSWLFL